MKKSITILLVYILVSASAFAQYGNDVFVAEEAWCEEPVEIVEVEENCDDPSLHEEPMQEQKKTPDFKPLQFDIEPAKEPIAEQIPENQWTTPEQVKHAAPPKVITQEKVTTTPIKEIEKTQEVQEEKRAIENEIYVNKNKDIVEVELFTLPETGNTEIQQQLPKEDERIILELFDELLKEPWSIKKEELQLANNLQPKQLVSAYAPTNKPLILRPENVTYQDKEHWSPEIDLWASFIVKTHFRELLLTGLLISMLFWVAILE